MPPSLSEKVIRTMLLENFKKSFDTGKVFRLLGAKEGRRISPSSMRRVDMMAEDVEGMLKPQLSYRILKLISAERGSIRLADGTRFKSPKISKTLANSDSVCCFLATVGPLVDMEIDHLMKQRRYADAYVLDALGSMSAENVVEQFYQRMSKRQADKQGGVTLRFSPGYCDWPIQQQHELFALFENSNTPEIDLSDSCLMSPRKSVSGLFGLLPPGVPSHSHPVNPCNSCTKRDCIARRSN